MPALKVSIHANQRNSFDHWVSLSVAYKQHSDQNQLEKQRGIKKIEIQHFLILRLNLSKNIHQENVFILAWEMP